MNQTLKQRFQAFVAFLNQGKTPYFICVGLIILGTALVEEGRERLESLLEGWIHRDPPMPSGRLARRAGHWGGK